MKFTKKQKNHTSPSQIATRESSEDSAATVHDEYNLRA